MIAIALMALTFFACKKQEPKKAEGAVLSIRIDDAELRAIEGQIDNGTTTTITKDVKVILNNGAGRVYTLSSEQINKAKTEPGGCKLNVEDVVTSVTLIANAEVTDNTAITDWQGKGGNTFKTDIPLTATATGTQITTTTEGGKTIYKAELTPTPAFARLEVFGKIIPEKNKKTSKSAFESIEVKEVYINNYLDTRNATKRYFTDHNATLDGFETAKKTNSQPLKNEMKDVIPTTDKTAFEGGTKAAAYQLFPKKTNETDGNYDHVILKLSIKYSQDAQKKGLPKDPVTRYVTIKKFMKATTDDLKNTGFLAGTIYKLDLKGLNDHFKTKEDGTPDPTNPDTTEPESTGKKELQLIVKPCTWTSQNILPQL